MPGCRSEVVGRLRGTVTAEPPQVNAPAEADDRADEQLDAADDEPDRDQQIVDDAGHLVAPADDQFLVADTDDDRSLIVRPSRLLRHRSHGATAATPVQAGEGRAPHGALRRGAAPG